jgi:hypothetical protein
MKWVNANDRLPVLYGRYYVKIDGRRDIIDYHEFSKRKEFSTCLLWLDEDEPRNNGNNKISHFKQVYGLP